MSSDRTSTGPSTNSYLYLVSPYLLVFGIGLVHHLLTASPITSEQSTFSCPAAVQRQDRPTLFCCLHLGSKGPFLAKATPRQCVPLQMPCWEQPGWDPGQQPPAHHDLQPCPKCQGPCPRWRSCCCGSKPEGGSVVRLPLAGTNSEHSFELCTLFSHI